jgi:serpin B
MALGMADAFDRMQADFTGMVDLDELGQLELQPPMIGFALHKAFINVDEQGTEAAAATGIGATPAGATSYQPIEVRVDRPFLLAIRDTVTGTILFLGRVLDPSG